MEETTFYMSKDLLTYFSKYHHSVFQNALGIMAVSKESLDVVMNREMTEEITRY